MGVSKERAIAYLKTLNSGKYLLIVRGYKEDIWHLEHILEEEDIKPNI